MNNNLPFQLLLIALFAVANLPVLIHLLNQRKRSMLDFSKIQATVNAISADVTALQAQAAASNDATNQAAIDALDGALATARTNLQALLPPAPDPVVEPAPVVEQPQ